MKKTQTILAAFAGALLFSFAQPRAGADQEAVAKQIPFYPAETCVVSGEPLTAMGEPLNVMHEGRLVRLCCKGCKKPFEKDPASFIGKLDEMAKAKQMASYPLEKCVISDEPLMAMGGPLDLIVEGRLVRVCCKGCKKPVAKDPGAAFAKIDAALIESQKASYPLDKCVVTGEPLDNAVDHLYGFTLVRLANADAVAAFEKEPARFVKAVEAARAKAMKSGRADKAEKAHAGHGEARGTR